MMGRQRVPSKEIQECQVEIFNLKYPVGTPVKVTLDNGEVRQTRTTSPACMLSGHTAVVWLEGISGCYLLARVEAAA